MVRLNDVTFSDKSQHQAMSGAFIKNKNGYIIYATKATGNQLMLIDLKKNSVKITGYVFPYVSSARRYTCSQPLDVYFHQRWVINSFWGWGGRHLQIFDRTFIVRL